ncbi:rhodanese-like domain-containing protein [Rhodobacteraceae bacterium B1Z28]|uniref:Rhodanese-like domain-containing protein n=1 Tax=Ruegeria haliotis TaxID=2747601 RepID=A0ABX2PSQ2_9RHOB|nr:rhodanese-like domain-containing protein [Ruegeria haliotis]NVO57190.1 rhodanese-like domain-containing protein [Ruegeria haliotis]
MPMTVKDMMQAANAAVERIDTAEARTLLEQGGLLLDIRDTTELQQTGRAVGAHHIPRGMLEFRADDTLQSHDPELRKDRPIVLYCVSGGRSALAGKLLRDMGYARVYNLGGLIDWANGGGEIVDS